MKPIILFFLMAIASSCQFNTTSSSFPPAIDVDAKKNINQVMESWHKAAAEANFEPYFDLMSKDGVFIGTDATENWQNDEFRKFSKPYFDAGKAWSFSTLERNIYIAETGQTAWFDELLDTQMGICRGSGVLTRGNGNWKIKHYVLSIAIPNEHVTEVVRIKQEVDSVLISKLKEQK